MNTPIKLHVVSNNTVAALDERLGSNAAAVILDDFIVAVDAGMRPYAARLFREALESTFDRQVKYLCLTHYHADHAFGISPFKDATIFGAVPIAQNLKQSPDWSPEAMRRWKEDDAGSSSWVDEVEFIIPPILFYQRMDITNRGRFIEFHNPGGHTSCSVYGYLPDERVLLAADLLFAGGFPYAGDGSADPERWMVALKDWLKLDIDAVIPGHGPVSGKEEIARQLEFFIELKANTIKALKKGREFSEIELPSIYPVDDDHRWFAEKTLKRWHSFYSKKG